MPAGEFSVQDHPSPNRGPRRGDGLVDTVVIHYTDTQDIGHSLDILCDPAREVSAHYLIDENGAIIRLVEEEYRAWHAGVSFWRGHQDINSRSIGIELQNPGERFGYRPFPAIQLDALSWLVDGIKQRWPIQDRNIIGHSDIAPDRKADPGYLFDWRGFAEKGHGLWPLEAKGDPDGLRDDLIKIGYDPGCENAIGAFQQHFRPNCVDNEPDAETAGIAAALLRLIEATAR